MSSGSDKDYKGDFAFVIKIVNEKKIPADMTFTVTFPVPFYR